MKLPHSSLKTRLLALVGSMLFLELIFASLLLIQLQEAEVELAKESKMKEVYRLSQALIYQLYDYEQNLEDWSRHNDQAAEAKARQIAQKMRDEIAWLEKNLQNNSQLYEQIEELKHIQESMFKIVDKAKEILGRSHSKLQLMALGQHLAQRADSMRRKWERLSVNLINDEEGLLDTFPELNQKRRHTLSLLVAAGVLLNVAIISGFAYLFMRSIVSRLKIMVRNTRRLSMKEKLLPRIGGADELGQLDDALHKMAESIESAQKERQAFLSIVSHELRTPLMAVTATFELLGAGILGKLGTDASRISDASDKKLNDLLNLINDLLDLEKLEAGKLSMNKRPIYIERAIEKAIEQVQEKADSKDIRILVQESELELEADADRLAQAIKNLLLNAIHASTPGSIIEIELSEKELNKRKPGESQKTLELKVLDRAGGVPEELEAQIFERFRKINQDIIKGMGLPIARKIVEAHSGKISYEKRAGGGSVFCLHLPTISAAA